MVYNYDDLKFDKLFGKLGGGGNDCRISPSTKKNRLYRVRFDIFYGKVDMWWPLIFLHKA